MKIATCKNCGEEVVLIGNAWVCTRSGDDGGTYDACEAIWDAQAGAYAFHQVEGSDV
jgi:hypothetical protein